MARGWVALATASERLDALHVALLQLCYMNPFHVKRCPDVLQVALRQEGRRNQLFANLSMAGLLGLAWAFAKTAPVTLELELA